MNLYRKMRWMVRSLKSKMTRESHAWVSSSAKTGLDELPQLINILRGEMSIVGPRPPLPREVAQYTPYQKQRLYVTPGLTCYWQVQPNRNEMSFDEWIELDLKYINEPQFLAGLEAYFSNHMDHFGNVWSMI